MPSTAVVRPTAGLKSTSNVVDMTFTDLISLTSTGGLYTVYASANGVSTLGVTGALSDYLPAAFDKFCTIYS